MYTIAEIRTACEKAEISPEQIEQMLVKLRYDQIKAILRRYEAVSGLPITELKKRSNAAAVSIPRVLLCIILWRDTKLSSIEAGKIMGLDGSTVRAFKQKLESEIKYNPQVRDIWRKYYSEGKKK